MGKPSTIKIDDVEYVRADSIKPDPLSDYSIIRAKSGILFGIVESSNDATNTAVVLNCRQLWSWTAASGINALDIATVGVSSAKMTHTVQKLTVLDVVQIIPCSDVASKIIREWPVCNKK